MRRTQRKFFAFFFSCRETERDRAKQRRADEKEEEDEKEKKRQYCLLFSSFSSFPLSFLSFSSIEAVLFPVSLRVSSALLSGTYVSLSLRGPCRLSDEERQRERQPRGRRRKRREIRLGASRQIQPIFVLFFPRRHAAAQCQSMETQGERESGQKSGSISSCLWRSSVQTVESKSPERRHKQTDFSTEVLRERQKKPSRSSSG